MSDLNPNEPISVGDPHGGSHGIAPASDPAQAAENFTDAEWASLRTDDFAAGRAVVILMLSIFLTGVALYSIVAYAVIS